MRIATNFGPAEALRAHLSSVSETIQNVSHPTPNPRLLIELSVTCALSETTTTAALINHFRGQSLTGCWSLGGRPLPSFPTPPKGIK